MDPVPHPLVLRSADDAQMTADDVRMTPQLWLEHVKSYISNLIDIDFFHDNIHGGSGKNRVI